HRVGSRRRRDAEERRFGRALAICPEVRASISGEEISLPDADYFPSRLYEPRYCRRFRQAKREHLSRIFKRQWRQLGGGLRFGEGAPGRRGFVPDRGFGWRNPGYHHVLRARLACWDLGTQVVITRSATPLQCYRAALV